MSSYHPPPREQDHYLRLPQQQQQQQQQQQHRGSSSSSSMRPQPLSPPPPAATAAAAPWAAADAMLGRGSSGSRSPARGQQQQPSRWPPPLPLPPPGSPTLRRYQQQAANEEQPQQWRAVPAAAPSPPPRSPSSFCSSSSPFPSPCSSPPPPPKTLGRSLADLAQHRVHGRVPLRFDLELIPLFASDLPPAAGPRARLVWERGQKAYATEPSAVNPNTRAVFWQERLVQRATFYWDPEARGFARKEYVLKLQAVRGGGGEGGEVGVGVSGGDDGGGGARAAGGGVTTATVARVSVDLAAYCSRDPAAAALPPIESYFDLRPFGRVKMSVKATWRPGDCWDGAGGGGGRVGGAGAALGSGGGSGSPGWLQAPASVAASDYATPLERSGSNESKEGPAWRAQGAGQQPSSPSSSPPVVRPMHSPTTPRDPFDEEDARQAALRGLQAELDERRARAEGKLRGGLALALDKNKDRRAAGGGSGGGGVLRGCRWLLHLLFPCCVPSEEQVAARLEARAREEFARKVEEKRERGAGAGDGEWGVEVLRQDGEDDEADDRRGGGGVGGGIDNGRALLIGAGGRPGYAVL